MYDFPSAPTPGQEYTPPVGGQTYIWQPPRWLVKGIPPTAAGGGIPEAPVDSQQYAREDANWTVVEGGGSDWGIKSKFTYVAPDDNPPGTGQIKTNNLGNEVWIDWSDADGNYMEAWVGVLVPGALLVMQNTENPLDWRSYKILDVDVSSAPYAVISVEAFFYNSGGGGPYVWVYAAPGSGIGGGGVEEAPTDGTQYGRQSGAWTEVAAGVSDWADITGKPATFPPTLPIAQSGVTNLTTDLAGKAPTVHTHVQADVANLVADLATKAPLVSPTFTGDPRAPTPTAGDNDTSIATTAFVTGALTTAKATANTDYVNVVGDTMTGNLVVNPGNIQISKPGAYPGLFIDYDSTFGGYLQVTKVFAPRYEHYFDDTAYYFKKYNDAGTGVNAFTLTRSNGLITVLGDPTAALGIATKQYVDNKASGLTDAPSDGKQYVRKDGAWVETPFIFDTNGDAVIKFGATIMVRIKPTGLILTKDDIEVFSVSV